MTPRYVVSGTDTGIGKTVFPQRLPAHWEALTGRRSSRV